MGGSLADHDPVAAGTEGSEFNHASEDATSTAVYPHASPSTTSTPSLAIHPCSAWEDRDKMRGLVINFPHHLSSIVSNKEPTPRALSEISALLRKSGAHTRFPEDSVDQTSVLAVS